ncbi:MAG TPA: hypothetical protein PLV92_00990, partial [Pirellulaceae bacterium]|nr:hypothetical protein [Pirellulaceae bacterium]
SLASITSQARSTNAPSSTGNSSLIALPPHFLPLVPHECLESRAERTLCARFEKEGLATRNP